jgi:hypothetical protein
LYDQLLANSEKTHNRHPHPHLDRGVG